MRSAIQRYEKAELGANEEEFLIPSILPHESNCAILRQSVHDRPEGRAGVARDELVGLHVVAAMAIHRRVRGPLVEVGGVDSGDVVVVIAREPARFALTSVKGLPPWRLTWSFPSSVPAQITPAFTGQVAGGIMEHS